MCVQVQVLVRSCIRALGTSCFCTHHRRVHCHFEVLQCPLAHFVCLNSAIVTRLCYLNSAIVRRLCCLNNAIVGGLCRLNNAIVRGLCCLNNAIVRGLCRLNNAIVRGLCRLNNAIVGGLCCLNNAIVRGLCCLNNAIVRGLYVIENKLSFHYLWSPAYIHIHFALTDSKQTRLNIFALQHIFLTIENIFISIHTSHKPILLTHEQKQKNKNKIKACEDFSNELLK